MAEQKIIAVFGATGAQGGGLVRAILADPQGGFVARAITRDTKTDKAQELARLGAEVVAADVDDPASIAAALRGAYGAYFVTFFWAHFSPEKEYAEAASMASAAKTAGLKHAIWSTLEDSRLYIPLSDNRMPTLQGKYKVPHFDAKGEADALFTKAGVPTTFLRTSFYWENLIHFGMGPKRGADGKLVFTLPMGDRKLPSMAAEDIGRCAYGIFKQGPGAAGKTIGIAGEHLSGADFAAALSKVFGEPVAYYSPSFEAYRGFGFPGADDLGNMFQFNHDFAEEFARVRDVRASRALNPQLQTFAAWLAKNRSQIPVG